MVAGIHGVNFQSVLQLVEQEYRFLLELVQTLQKNTMVEIVKERLLVSSHAITKMHAQVRIVVANII